MQEDGHGGQEPDLQGGECVWGVCVEGTHLPTHPTSVCSGSLAGHHLATRNTAANGTDQEPALKKLTIRGGEARTA